MKTAILPCLVLVGALMAKDPAPSPASKSQAPDNHELPSPRHVQVTLEMIEVSQADATQLLYKDKFGKDGTKLRAALQAMVDSQKASVLETMMVVSHSGTKATSESIREVIYPTEYLPSCGLFEDPTKKENETPNDKALKAAMTAVCPSAFETRNTGSTLEIEPTIGNDGSIIDLRVAPEILFEAGNRKWSIHKDELGNELAVEMPFFYSIRTSTALTLADGAPELLCVLTPKNAEGIPDRTRKVFAIVTADVVTQKARP